MSVYEGVIGRVCVVRGSGTGVHIGTVKSVEPRDTALVVEVTDSRRLWRWKARGEDRGALSAVAMRGLDPDPKETKLDDKVPWALVTGVCELIACSPACIASLDEVKL